MTDDNSSKEQLMRYLKNGDISSLEKIQREQRKKLIFTILSVVVFIVATVLSLVWLGWQFYICVSLLLWANNLSNKL